jgi:hypothetical protein
MQSIPENSFHMRALHLCILNAPSWQKEIYPIVHVLNTLYQKYRPHKRNNKNADDVKT